MRSLWRGLGPTLWRDVPFSGIYWAGYEGWKKVFKRHGMSGAWVAFLSGAVSGTSAALITSPFDVLKTRPLFRRGEGGRPATYSPEDYFDEFGVVMTAINNDANIPIKNNTIGPSISASQWSAEDVFNTGYIQAYTNNLGMIAVEKCVNCIPALHRLSLTSYIQIPR